MAAKASPKKKLSVIKRVRQANKRKLRNQSFESKIKTHITKLDKVIQGKNKEEIEQTLRETIKVINSIASKGIIHKNTASRKISRITKKTNAALAG